MTPEHRLTEFKIELPPAPKPAGLYRPVVIVDGLAYLSGHLPTKADGTLLCGRLGDGLDLAAGQEAARRCGLAMLATLRGHLGSLDRVTRLIKLLGLVNASPDFVDHPKVINGCSELFADVFGPEHGVGARSALGVASLPANAAVEIEAIFEVEAPAD